MHKLADCSLKKLDGEKEKFHKQGFEIEKHPKNLDFTRDQKKLKDEIRRIAQSERFDGILIGGNLHRALKIRSLAIKYNIPCYTFEKGRLIQVRVRVCMSGCHLPTSLEFGQSATCPKCGNQIGNKYQGGKPDEK